MGKWHDEGRDGNVGEEGHPVQLVEELQVGFSLQDETSVGVMDEEGPELKAVEEGGGVDVDNDISTGNKEATEGSSELGLLLKNADPQEAEDAHWNQQTWSQHSIVLNNCTFRLDTSWNFMEEMEKYKYKFLDTI